MGLLTGLAFCLTVLAAAVNCETFSQCKGIHGTYISSQSGCRYFIYCNDEHSYESSCPQGLAFNPADGICDSPDNVQCHDESVEPPRPQIVCPSPPSPDSIAFLPSPISCSEYYICYHGTANKMTCSDNLHFNSKTQSCVSPQAANCQIEPTPPYISVPTTPSDLLRPPSPGEPIGSKPSTVVGPPSPDAGPPTPSGIDSTSFTTINGTPPSPGTTTIWSTTSAPTKTTNHPTPGSPGTTSIWSTTSTPTKTTNKQTPPRPDTTSIWSTTSTPTKTTNKQTPPRPDTTSNWSVTSTPTKTTNNQTPPRPDTTSIWSTTSTPTKATKSTPTTIKDNTNTTPNWSTTQNLTSTTTALTTTWLPTPTSAQSSLDLIEQCTRQTNGMFSHPYDCHYYYRCVNGSLSQQKCPSGLGWDTDKKMCSSSACLP